MELNKIWNESNDVTMREHIDEKSIDLVLTSPPYNLARVGKKQRHTVSYDEFSDNLPVEDYCKWIVSIFQLFDRILKKDGVILWNANYNVEKVEGELWLSIADVIRQTPFMIMDQMIWEKKVGLPITQQNKLTRLCENVFIFARREEQKTFKMNKEYSSTSHTGQHYYKPVNNIIKAANNDEVCELNSANYSTDLCYKLLSLYAPENSIVYDPFMGTGTTAVACKNMGLTYIGSELSAKQCEWAENRLLYGKGSVDKGPDKRSLF